MSSCVPEIVTFTLLYRLKIAAAVGFSISDDCSRAMSGLLAFLLRTFASGNLKISVLTHFRSTDKEEKHGLWMYERRKDRKGKGLVLLLVI